MESDKIHELKLSKEILRVDGEVESHKFNKFLVVGFSDHVAVVCGPIKGGIGGSEGGVITVKIVVDLSGDWDQVSDTVHAIFVNVFPVGGLVNASFVSLKIFIFDTFIPKYLDLISKFFS